MPVLYDWSNFAFESKRPLRELQAQFMPAPRQMSLRRLKQLCKQYLPDGNILLGVAKEAYIDGFDGQPQFRTLTLDDVHDLAETIAASKTVHKLYLLRYSQRELPYILEKISFKKILLVNGSWHYTFHTRPEFYKIVQQETPFEYISPFADEAEAQRYALEHESALTAYATMPQEGGTYNATQMFLIAERAAKLSYDYSYQIGVALGKRIESKADKQPIHGRGDGEAQDLALDTTANTEPRYKLVATTHNKIVPYETYALHHGNAREKHFAPSQDLNHYDTVHAETELVIKAATKSIDLRGTTLFINLLPCPTCARMLADTPISGVVYQRDHSDGYAIAMLEKAGKTVRRVVSDL